MRTWTIGLVAPAILALAPAAGAQQAPPERPKVSVTVPAQPQQRKGLPLPEAGKAGVPLSLRDAIAIALANNVDLQVAVADAEAGRYGVLQARGIFDPVLALTGQDSDQEQPQASRVFGSKTKTYDGNLSVAQEIPFGGVVTLGWNNEKQESNSAFFTVNPAYTSSAFVQFSQPLLRNFGIATTMRLIASARNSQNITDESFRLAVQSTIQAVEQAYWNLVYARQNLKVKEEARDLAQELYRITKIKIDVGSQAPIDIVQTEAGVAQAELDIISARSAVGDAEDQLKRLLNFGSAGRWADHIDPTDAVEVEPAKVDTAAGMEEAMRLRPEVRQALFQAGNARITYDFAKNQLLPQLNLDASYGYAGLGGNQYDVNGNLVARGGYSDALQEIRDRQFHNWSVGLNFSVPVGNRAARGARAQARWQLSASLASLEQLRQNIVVGVRTAARAVQTAEESIVAAGKNRELAEKNLDAEKKKYDNGLVTSFEVLQVQNALSAARTSELQALTQYRVAILGYHVAIGDLLAWKDIKVEGLREDPAPDASKLALR